MNVGRWIASLFSRTLIRLWWIAAFAALATLSAYAIRTPIDTTPTALSGPLVAVAEPAPSDTWLIESVYSLGLADDGSHLDLVVLVAPETHTRAICIVQSPLGLDPLKWEELKSQYSGYEDIEVLKSLRETILEIPIDPQTMALMRQMFASLKRASLQLEELDRYAQAAINLQYFLDVEKREGLTEAQDTVTIDPAWLNQSKAIQRGKEYNRERFRGEHERDQIVLGNKHIHEWAAQRLRGATTEVKVPVTEWHRVTVPSMYTETPYFAAHNKSAVVGHGDFVAKMLSGGRLGFSGKIAWTWYDRYDWTEAHQGIELPIPKIDNGLPVIKNGRLVVKKVHFSDRVWKSLQEAGFGKEYKMISTLGEEDFSWSH